MHTRCLRRWVGMICLVSCAAPSAASAATFVFGSSANGLTGQTSATLTSGEFTMQLSAGPVGAGLVERPAPLRLVGPVVEAPLGAGRTERVDAVAARRPKREARGVGEQLIGQQETHLREEPCRSGLASSTCRKKPSAT